MRHVFHPEAALEFEEAVRFYRANGPSAVAESVMFDPNNSFGLEGYLAMLIGQGVPHAKPYSPSAAEAKLWNDRCNTWALEARRALDVKQSLEALRKHGMK